METEVRAHESHSKTGGIEHISEHEMHINPEKHRHHLERLEEEIDALKHQRERG
jgi:hypothetical protein